MSLCGPLYMLQCSVERKVRSISSDKAGPAVSQMVRKLHMPSMKGPWSEFSSPSAFVL